MTLRRSTKPFGQRGEQLAVRHLQELGYELRETNWRCSFGEIDIIVQKDETLVFVEVRTRHADSTEPAFESITPRKRAKLLRLAEAYVDEHKLGDCLWRIDVIAIGIPRSGMPIIEHSEDALDW